MDPIQTPQSKIRTPQSDQSSTPQFSFGDKETLNSIIYHRSSVPVRKLRKPSTSPSPRTSRRDRQMFPTKTSPKTSWSDDLDVIRASLARAPPRPLGASPPSPYKTPYYTIRHSRAGDEAGGCLSHSRYSRGIAIESGRSDGRKDRSVGRSVRSTATHRSRSTPRPTPSCRLPPPPPLLLSAAAA